MFCESHECAPFIFTVGYVQEIIVYGIGFGHLPSNDMLCTEEGDIKGKG